MQSLEHTIRPDSNIGKPWIARISSTCQCHNRKKKQFLENSGDIWSWTGFGWFSIWCTRVSRACRELVLAFWHSPPRTEIRLMPLSLGTRRHLSITAFCSDYETLLDSM